MPDAFELYPKAPAPQQGLFGGDPLRMIGAIGQLNQNALFQRQFPALAETPAAALRGTNIANETAQLEQNAKQIGILAGHFGALDDKSTPDDVHHLTVSLSRVYPNIPARTLNQIAGIVLNDPNGLKHGLATVRTLGLSSAQQASRVEAPPSPTGAPQTQPLANANYAGTYPTALPPGVGQAAERAGAGSGELLSADRVNGANYRQQVTPLEQAIPALERLGKTGTGPGTEEFNKIKDFDESKKYLVDWVRQNGNSGTNDQLAAAFAGSPSVKISNAAALDVAKTALALRRMSQAKLLTFEQSGQPESQYASWAARWNAQQDPRAFGYDMMSAEQQKKLLGSMKKGSPEYIRFLKSLRVAHDGGVLNQ